MTDRCTRIVHKALAVVRPQFRLHLAGGIHGLPHWSRVWFHGRALAAAADVDPAVLAWFAFLHDISARRPGARRRRGASRCPGPGRGAAGVIMAP
jgi:HD superfamily phosphodiesterase